MSLGLMISVILHLSVVVFLFFGFSFWPSSKITPPASIPMEIVNISELSVAPKTQRTIEEPIQAPPPTPKTAPKETEILPPTPEVPPLPTEPMEELSQETPVEKEITPPLPKEPEESSMPSLEEPKPKEEPLPKAPPKKPKKKETPKEAPKKEKKKTSSEKKKTDDPFDDVLKAVEDLKTPQERQPKAGELSEKTQINEAAIIGEVLSISELDALRRQFSQCWSPPTGLKGAEDMIVDLAVSINPDGSVQEVRILDQARYNQDPRFQPAADAARRAVLNPACNPLKIPPNKYHLLKSFVLKFNPAEMF